MATTKEYYEYVMECLNKAGEVTSRKMMGEYCRFKIEVVDLKIARRNFFNGLL